MPGYMWHVHYDDHDDDDACTYIDIDSRAYIVNIDGAYNVNIASADEHHKYS